MKASDIIKFCNFMRPANRLHNVVILSPHFIEMRELSFGRCFRTRSIIFKLTSSTSDSA